MSDDFSSLDHEEQRRRLTAAGRDALTEWAIDDADLSVIKYRENAVFAVRHSGGRHALRLHRVGYHSNDELRSELQWMQALQHAGVAVPVVVPTTSGALYTTRSGDGLPGEIQIDLFEWIDGEQLGSVEEGLTDESSVTSTFATIGELAAQVHNQASNWTPPEGFVRHAWDADGLAGEQPVWGRFWDYGRATPEQQELMLRARETIYERLSRLPKTSESYSMIHADFAPENVLVDGDRVRLIDFDDAGFGWHMFEIATSLYFVREEPAYQAAFDAIIDGYRRYRDLDDETLAQLPVLNLARAFAYVGWVHTRPETETAQELGPTFLQMALDTAQEYWDNH